MSKKRMTKFRITEISAVDRPAQEHARMTIRKSADDEPEPKAFDSFADAVDYIAKRHQCPRHEAMSLARQAHPDLMEAEQARTDAEVAKHAEDIAKAKEPTAAQTEFVKKVDEVMRRDGISHLEAMRRAREENPAMFKRYQQEDAA